MTDEDGLAHGLDCNQEGWELGLRLIPGLSLIRPPLMCTRDDMPTGRRFFLLASQEQPTINSTCCINRQCSWEAKLMRTKPPCMLPSGQRLEERFGLLQVGSVKALGEPAVDRCQQLAGVVPLALALPQPAQAYGSPQL
jgi:hypothetical protein